MFPVNLRREHPYNTENVLRLPAGICHRSQRGKFGRIFDTPIKFVAFANKE
jgi:hypothetical protein